MVKSPFLRLRLSKSRQGTFSMHSIRPPPRNMSEPTKKLILAMGRLRKSPCQRCDTYVIHIYIYISKKWDRWDSYIRIYDWSGKCNMICPTFWYLSKIISFDTIVVDKMLIIYIYIWSYYDHIIKSPNHTWRSSKSTYVEYMLPGRGWTSQDASGQDAARPIPQRRGAGRT